MSERLHDESLWSVKEDDQMCRPYDPARPMTLGVIISVAHASIAAGALAMSLPCHANELPESAKLFADDGAVGDDFGISVDVDDGHAIVGARSDDDLGVNAGAAYIFVDDGGEWVQVARLDAFDGAENHGFGLSVGLSGMSAIVGAPGVGDFGEASGAAYTFVYENGTWQHQGKIIAADAHQWAFFGSSVDVNGNVAIVGAPGTMHEQFIPGAAYVFRYDSAGRAQEQKLVPQVVDEHVADFGRAVAISDDVAVVGAPFTSPEIAPGEWLSLAGAAYVFRYVEDVWVEEAILSPSDASTNDRLGISVAIDGDVAIVGAASDDDPEVTGAAYIFRRINGVWTQELKIHVDAGSGEFDTATAVAISGDTVLVGPDIIEHNGSDVGAASVYRFNGWGWSLTARLFATDGVMGNQFGHAVGLRGNHGIVGAWQGSNGEVFTGAAYLYDVDALPPRCPADLNDDQVVDVTDLLTLLGNWGGSGVGDVNTDGIVDVADLLLLLAAWGEC